MINNLFIFIVAIFLVVKGATLATKYAAALAESFCLSRYVVGFIIVAVISILPETFIAVNSALEGIPSFGLGTLLGSNVADLTLVFAVIVFYAGRGLKVESKILKNNAAYPFMLLVPVILGLNGHFSRWEGAALIVAGGAFYYLAFRGGREIENVPEVSCGESKSKSFLWLLFSMMVLLVGAHFTVTSASALAGFFGVNPVLIGMLVVGLGTTIPELLFSLKSVKKHDDSLAIGDILGTVLADATIVVGILALVNPFYFPKKIIYIPGIFMVAAAFILFNFITTERNLNKKEAYALIIIWLAFVIAEFIANT